MIELKTDIKLIISKELQQQILYTHSIIGSKEWCSIVLFKEISGSIQDKNLVLQAQKMYPIMIGTETYVGGDISDEYAKLLDFYSDAMDYKWGYTHTHHSMQTTPSTTDMQEVQDQASNYEYFLSLIVNFSGKYSAKLSFLGKMDSDIFYETKFGKYPYSISKEAVFYTDVQIELETEDTFKTLLQELKTKNTPKSEYGYGFRKEESIIGNTSRLANIPNYGKSPYRQTSLYEERYGEYPEYIRSASSYNNITGEYLVREILTSSDVNLLNLKTNSTFSLVQAYTLISDQTEEYEEILDSITLLNEDIVSNSLKTNKNYLKYNDEMIEAYKKIIDYLLSFSKVDTNGFISRFIVIIIEELNSLFDSDQEFDMYLKERGLIDYYAE